MLLCGIFIPVQAVMLPLLSTMKSAGLSNNLFGIALVYTGMNLPLALMLYCGYYRGIPNELLEASVIDGCRSIQTYLFIILPLSKTIVSTVVILSGLQIWRDFFVPLILSSSTKTKTIAISLMHFIGFYNYDWTGICAAMMMQSLPMLIIFVFLQKYFLSGVVAGAVKG
jgi:raffinose/stachyose/melibiose transport system permease protein